VILSLIVARNVRISGIRRPASHQEQWTQLTGRGGRNSSANERRREGNTPMWVYTRTGSSSRKISTARQVPELTRMANTVCAKGLLR